MNVVYNIGLPARQDNPSADQPGMLINTVGVNTILGIDHIPFNTNLGGFHLKSTYPVTYTLAAPPPTAANQVAVYSANTTPGSVLAYTRDNIGFGIPLTTAYNPVANTSGLSSLAGGIIMQWGQAALSSRSGTVNFPVPFPNNAFSVSLTMNLTGASGPHGVWISSSTGLAKSGFSWNSDTSGNLLYWIAIGN